jgi:hypothetical protein
MSKHLSRRGWLRSAMAALLGPWAARLLGAGPAAAAPPVPAGPVPVSGVGAVTTYCYDAVGLPPQGPVTRTVYDAAGNVWITFGGPCGTTYTYDALGRRGSGPAGGVGA